jgi:hypothetical protein
MIHRAHDLPITNQAAALNISRGSVYYLPRPVSAADLALMRRLDELYLEFPFAGSRLLRDLLAAESCRATIRIRVRTRSFCNDGLAPVGRAHAGPRVADLLVMHHRVIDGGRQPERLGREPAYGGQEVI